MEIASASGRANPDYALGFDFGYKRIGIAVGQKFTKTARPLPQLIPGCKKTLWKKINDLITVWRPASLVVGYPLNMNDTPSPLSKASHQFAQALKVKFKLPVALVDERLSTREAIERAAHFSKKKRTQKSIINSLAAQIILETWLKTQ